MRFRIDYPSRLADASTMLARAEYLRREAVEALLLNLERQIIGSVLRDGRNALRVVLRYTDDLFSWDGYRFYQACIFVAAITGPQPPGRYTSMWSTSELRAISELSGIRMVDLLYYFHFTVKRRVLPEAAKELSLWMAQE